MSSSSQFSSQGFDLDAVPSDGNSENVVLEVGGGATAVVATSSTEDGVIAKSEQYKAKGNEQFKAGKYLDAYDCYTDAIESTPGMTGQELLELRDEFVQKERAKAREEYQKLDEERRKQHQESSDQSTPTPPTPPDAPSIEFKAPPHEYGKQLSVYYCNRAAALLHMERYEEATQDCDVALLLNPKYTKALIRRCTAFEKTEKYDDALHDAQLAYSLQPTPATKKTIQRLKRLQEEQMEKLKKETMGQLKELGNSLLGNFGLSLDNFNAVQDPNTGSYSISFNQNKQE